MKKTYITPSIKRVFVLSEQIMEKISIPTTGNVDDPSMGQTNEFSTDGELFEEDEKETNIWNE